MNERRVLVVGAGERTEQLPAARPRLWPSWAAVVLVPAVLIVVDLVVEPAMTAGRLSMDAGNTIAFVIGFVLLAAAIAVSSLAIRAGRTAARWPLAVAVVMTAAWAVLCVAFYLS